MRYIIAGPTIVNDILFEDGRLSKGHLGGSVFCLAGIKLWCDDCLYVSNVGQDFETHYGKWMDDNACSRDGLNWILPHTRYSLLTYDRDGLHSEDSVYGEEEDRIVSRLDLLDARFIAGHCDGNTRGIYVEAGETDAFWENLDAIRSIGDIAVMWEPPTSAAMQAHRHKDVFATLRLAGLYSINLPEAMSLFRTKDEDAAIRAILDFGVPCYFRVGAKGSYMLCDGGAHFAPSVTLGAVVDTTGCGNASTAAALCGYCERRKPEEIAAMGNISAAYNLLQYGPYPKVTRETRAHAEELVRKIAGPR